MAAKINPSNVTETISTLPATGSQAEIGLNGDASHLAGNSNHGSDLAAGAQGNLEAGTSDASLAGATTGSTNVTCAPVAADPVGTTAATPGSEVPGTAPPGPAVHANTTADTGSAPATTAQASNDAALSEGSGAMPVSATTHDSGAAGPTPDATPVAPGLTVGTATHSTAANGQAQLVSDEATGSNQQDGPDDDAAGAAAHQDNAAASDGHHGLLHHGQDAFVFPSQANTATGADSATAVDLGAHAVPALDQTGGPDLHLFGAAAGAEHPIPSHHGHDGHAHIADGAIQTQVAAFLEQLHGKLANTHDLYL